MSPRTLSPTAANTGNADEAVAQGLRLVAEGADLVDVGGESSRPGAAPCRPKKKKRRILPVIRRLSEEGVVVSVDTAKPEVMRAAVDNGAQVINDINGFRHPQAPRRRRRQRMRG